MISVEIEKEINQENKVVLNFNLRQVVCLILLVISVILLIFVVKIDGDIIMYPMTGVAIVLFAFGWYKPNGIPFEKIFIKQIKDTIYRSNKRKYKTKNQYVVMVNEEYNRRKNIDMANKKLRKQVEKEQKKTAKELKKAAKSSVCKPVA
jgi:hypothetical protein